MWWPGIASYVKKKLVMSCKHCNIYRPSQNRGLLISTPLPKLPWQKLATDLCDYKGHHYLIVIDYFYRWLDIIGLPKTNSDTVTQKLKSIFTCSGIPKELMTYNGPRSQLNSSDSLQLSTIYNMLLQALISHNPMAWLNKL